MKKLLKSQITDNVLALGQQAINDGTATPVVIRDDKGVPTAWRVFSFGPFTITRNGVTLEGEFLPEHAASIIDYYQQKGTRIPIDSEHFLYRLAEKLGKSEQDALDLIPGGKAAMGFGTLEQQADGLWITGIEWVPFAYQLMAEGIYRWFSPVLRGFTDNRMRITSISMLNVPAVDNQVDVLAAGAESGDQSGRVPLYAISGAAAQQPQKKGVAMKKLLVKLGALLGLAEADAVALSAEGDAEAVILPKIEALIAELPRVRAESALAKSVRDALALGAEVEPAAVTGKLSGLLAKAGEYAGLKTKVDALELSAETEKKAKLIERGKAEGKLTPDMIAKWADKQDSVALAAFLDAAPVIVTPGLQVGKKDLNNGDVVALTAEDEAVARNLGISTEKMLEAKKAQQQK